MTAGERLGLNAMSNQIEFVEVRATPGFYTDNFRNNPALEVTVKSGVQLHRSRIEFPVDDFRSTWDRIFDCLKEQLREHMFKQSEQRRMGSNGRHRQNTGSNTRSVL